MNNKLAAVRWAQAVLVPNTIILDTETTGLHIGEIVQIAVIDITGKPLLDTLVLSRNPIPDEATNIHGITDDMVLGSPTWGLVAPQLIRVIQSIPSCNIVVYNAVYDRKMMHQSSEAWGMSKTDWKTLANWSCAMEAYAQFWGDWNEYHQSYRWQRLTQACEQQGIPEPEAPAHSALGDCLRTLALIQAMAAYETA